MHICLHRPWALGHGPSWGLCTSSEIEVCASCAGHQTAAVQFFTCGVTLYSDAGSRQQVVGLGQAGNLHAWVTGPHLPPTLSLDLHCKGQGPCHDQVKALHLPWSSLYMHGQGSSSTPMIVPNLHQIVLLTFICQCQVRVPVSEVYQAKTKSKYTVHCNSTFGNNIQSKVVSERYFSPAGLHRFLHMPVKGHYLYLQRSSSCLPD